MNFNRLYESVMETLEESKKCWDGYKKVPGIQRSKQGSCKPKEEDAEYKGRKVTLNKPTRGDVKKFKVYVNNPKSFRARHKCDQKKDRTTAGYWSCKKW